jgi:hypothetical protein
MGFKTERRLGEGGNWSQIYVVAADTTLYSDTGLSPGIYYYRFRSYNASGNSGYSNEVSASITDDNDNTGLPNDPEVSPCTYPNDAEADDDGIPDGVEDANRNGVVDAGETNPRNVDSDCDDMKDGTELGYSLLMLDLARI